MSGALGLDDVIGILVIEGSEAVVEEGVVGTQGVVFLLHLYATAHAEYI